MPLLLPLNHPNHYKLWPLFQPQIYKLFSLPTLPCHSLSMLLSFLRPHPSYCISLLHSLPASTCPSSTVRGHFLVLLFFFGGGTGD